LDTTINPLGVVIHQIPQHIQNFGSGINSRSNAPHSRGNEWAVGCGQLIGMEGKSGGGPPHSRTLARSRGCRDNAKRPGVRPPGRFRAFPSKM